MANIDTNIFPLELVKAEQSDAANTLLTGVKSTILPTSKSTRQNPEDWKKTNILDSVTINSMLNHLEVSATESAMKHLSNALQKIVENSIVCAHENRQLRVGVHSGSPVATIEDGTASSDNVPMDVEDATNKSSETLSNSNVAAADLGCTSWQDLGRIHNSTRIENPTSTMHATNNGNYNNNNSKNVTIDDFAEQQIWTRYGKPKNSGKSGFGVGLTQFKAQFGVF